MSARSKGPDDVSYAHAQPNDRSSMSNMPHLRMHTLSPIGNLDYIMDGNLDYEIS